MTGRIDNIYFDGLFRLRVNDIDGGILGEDSDATLAFEVIGIHDAFSDLLFSRKVCAWRNRKSTSVVLP